MSIRPWRDIARRKSRQIMVGNVPVGGDAPVTVQTMTNTPTSDAKATIDQIRRLEESVDRQLFDDNRRKLTLTHDGEVLLEFARAILRLNDEARDRFQATDITGHVTLGTPDLYASYILPEVLDKFSRAHPNVEVELRCTRSVHLHAALERGELDIALMTNQPEFRSGELVSRNVFVYFLVIYQAR